MSQPPTDPQSDADRIRLKRLAKLQASAPVASTSEQPSTATSSSGTPQRTESPKPAPQPKEASPKPPPAPVKQPVQEAPTSLPAKRKPTGQPENLDVASWTHETIGNVLNVTLEKEVAEKTGYQVVWLKPLAVELVSEGLSHPIRLTTDIVDRLLISRLEADPQTMSDDLEYVSVLASLPASQTVFEYLVGCWKRLNSAASSLAKRKYPPVEVQQATEVLDKLRDLVISYAGLSLQEPEMFPQPQDRALGPPELVGPLLSLSALSAPLLSSSHTGALSPTEVQPFLQDLSRRFVDPAELSDVLSGVVRQLLFHPSLAQREGLAGADSGWRRVLAGLEALVGTKGFAEVITNMPEWCPEHATAANIELVSLMGPLLRLGVIQRDWPYIAQTYFSEVEKRSQSDVDSSFASLRGTLKSLQGTLFQIFNALVRAGPGPREAVLKYFARVVALNVKRSGLQVEQETVASDSFMLNLQSVLLRFAEPFMDSKYSKLDRVDPLYFVNSDRIDAKEETRIKATAQEAADFAKEQGKGPTPNFISDIFFLTCALGHLGVQQTINRYEDSLKHYDEIRQHLEQLQADNSWMGTPLQARAEAAINTIKGQQSKLGSVQFAFRTSLEDPEFVFRSLTFANFVSTWILRFVDPKKTHPSPNLELPLPKDVPMSFRTLPEYIFEDVVETTLFYARYSPSSLALAGKNEIVVFALTFLTSTWYIKNPFLKSKLIEILYSGVSTRGRERDRGPLGPILHENPIALKHLMPALMHFYVEVEQTGASSQFYDKFSSRRLMAFLFKYIWNNPIHREALNAEAKKEDDKFVRFANLMISDVTYLMDESLNDMTQIHALQTEMADKATWEAQTPEYRKEKEKSLRQLERMASGYCDLSKNTVGLLKTFTAETRAPFMMPEVVDKLAAMLDYNLDALVGPRCQDLKVKDPSKYRFDPRQLLTDILQVYLNLGGEEAFVRAVAGDGRSYKKELFEKAMGIAKRRTLKTDAEIDQIRMFVVKVEEMKATIEAEEDLGEIPDEFTDPLMATIMRDPVILPTSRTIVDRSTIKSYLLSETRDPFNRQPLAIEDVIPDVELKAKIDAFLADRRNKRTALDVPEGDVVKMDINAREPDGMGENNNMEE